jgi:hypothetical protein
MERHILLPATISKLIALAGIAMLALILMPLATSAQTPQGGMTVRPSIFEDRLDPGDIYESSVRVTNETNQPQTYYVSVRDVVDITPGGSPIFATVDRPAALGVAEWMTVPYEPIEVAARGTVEIPFTVEVPDNATPGNHIGGIFIGTQGERPDQIGTGIAYQLVPIVNIQISGELIEDAEIRAFSTEQLFYGSPAVKFKVVINNNGNVSVRPRGPIEIINMFGEQVGQLVVNPDAGLIPPYASRTFDLDWEGEDGVFFGRYTANVTLGYGEQQGVKSLLRSISFWVLPLNVILPVLIGIIVVLGGMWLGIRMYIKSHLRAIERATGRKIKNVPHERQAISRLSFIAVFLLSFTVLFLLVLFMMFA